MPLPTGCVIDRFFQVITLPSGSPGIGGGCVGSRARGAADWDFAHRLSSIGHGYIWQNITIFSDGERTALIAKPTPEQPQTPFRYIADLAAVIPSAEFESELDRFIDEVIERLESEDVEGTNLHAIWKSVLEERRATVENRKRKLEALFGGDADESDRQIINQFLEDADRLGRPAIEEIAAEHGQGGKVITAEDIQEVAKQSGFDASPRDVVKLNTPVDLPDRGQTPAWRVGRDNARALRAQLSLGSEAISDAALEQMGGARSQTISSNTIGPNISFALDEKFDRGRIVLRSKWRTGRRFEFARLLGDRIVGHVGDRLLPATRAHTYRQKLQRSFAAELLSPFEAVDEMLAGDYSMENQLDVAEHFEVSPLTIGTLLVNHGRIEREDLDEELVAASA
jgi:hypothetical protein